MSKILSQLNEMQRLAVEQVDGPQMVIAGAGSGKTRVLTYKIAYMIERGIDPFNILALTFTNKAAKEMRERMFKLVDSWEARNVWMGTFHSVFSRILRQEGELLGYPSNFTIYDTDDSKRLIKAIIKELNLDDKKYAANLVRNRISAAKSSLITAAQYEVNSEILMADKQAQRPEIKNIYRIYAARCFKSSAMDFDDLLLLTYILFKKHPEVLLKYQRKFKYILVDEYQDTNHAQYVILKSLAAAYENITTVGDDAQSIYAFRGANIQNILNFKQDYPDAEIVKLEQNYRSTKIIVNAANSLIKHNKSQIPKRIWTDNDNGELIKVFEAASDNQEGKMVAASIFDNKMNHHFKNRHFAILYRTNSQSRAIEEALRKKGIDYRIYGGISFYGRKEVKDLLAYFRLTINPNDEEAFKRVINYPKRGIGVTSMNRVIIAANEKGLSLWNMATEANLAGVKVNSTTKTKIQNFREMVESFAAQITKLNAYDMANVIFKQTGTMADLQSDSSIEGLGRVENIEELLNAIKDFTDKTEEAKNDKTAIAQEKKSGDLASFMEDVALMTDSDQKEDKNSDKVSLMTIHAAKGLEFPVVYTVGMEENLFPSFMSLNSREEIEEERRLFYVALTRAMQKAYLSYAEMRYKWGELKMSEPSRFMEEVDEKYLEYDEARRPMKSVEQIVNQPKAQTQIKRKLKKVSEDNRIFQAKEKASSGGDIRVGMSVKHAKFGTGKVLQVEGSGANQKVSVQFPAVGTKNLLLRFAKLEIV